MKVAIKKKVFLMPGACVAKNLVVVTSIFGREPNIINVYALYYNHRDRNSLKLLFASQYLFAHVRLTQSFVFSCYIYDVFIWFTLERLLLMNLGIQGIDIRALYRYKNHHRVTTGIWLG